MRALGLGVLCAALALVQSCATSTSDGLTPPCGASGCPVGQTCQNGACVPAGSGGASGSTSSCAGTCATLAAAGCPKQSECVARCEADRAANPACTSTFDALTFCVVGSGTPACDANGHPTSTLPPGACQSAIDAHSSCLFGGTGGSGAAGGFGGTGGGFGGTGGGFGGTGGGFGGTGGTGGGFGGTGGGFGGSGGGGSCISSIQGLACVDVWDTTTPCGQCLAQSCCTPTSACMNDYTCSGLLECVAVNCATAVDVDACVQQTCPGCGTQDAIVKFNAIGTCAETSCAAACQ